jgi:hypothetical protein
MKTLLIVTGLFFSIFGAVIAFFAASDPGQEYDLKFVLPIDASQMPRPAVPPNVQSWTSGQEEKAPPSDGRVESGAMPALPDRPPVEFGGRPDAASESQLRP